MCRSMEELYEQGIAQGMEQGITQGIRAMVSTLQELSVPLDTAVEKLISAFELNRQTAEEKANLYWGQS